MSAHLTVAPASMAIQWGALQVTWGNLLLVLTMVAVFVLALVLPFPGDKDQP
jgi:hypothetical protein